MNNTEAMLAAANQAAAVGAANAKNIEYQQAANEENRAFSREMYALQRQHALEDWYRANTYNSPMQQMERLRQAGLNPNLVYGKGADNTATVVRASSNAPANSIAPRMDPKAMEGPLATYLALRNQKAQTDNIEANTSASKMEAILKQAQISQIGASTASTQFELEKSKALMDSTITKANLENVKLQTDTQINLDRNERERLSNATNISKTLQEIVTEKIKQLQIEQSTKRDSAQTAVFAQDLENLKTALENSKKEGVLKQWEIEQRAKGIYPNDPFFFKHFLNTFGGKQDSTLRFKKGAMWPE